MMIRAPAQDACRVDKRAEGQHLRRRGKEITEEMRKTTAHLREVVRVELCEVKRVSDVLSSASYGSPPPFLRPTGSPHPSCLEVNETNALSCFVRSPKLSLMFKLHTGGSPSAR
jgi:hypothetical protein